MLTSHAARQDPCPGLLFSWDLLQPFMPARAYLKSGLWEVQEKVSVWAIWLHTELQGLQMGKKAGICLVMCWGLLGISCSSKSWKETAFKMPPCDNFKKGVLQCPDFHSWSDGAGQGIAQHTLALKPLTCWDDILCSHAQLKWSPSWGWCFPGYLGILCWIFPFYPRDL